MQFWALCFERAYLAHDLNNRSLRRVIDPDVTLRQSPFGVAEVPPVAFRDAPIAHALTVDAPLLNQGALPDFLFRHLQRQDPDVPVHAPVLGGPLRDCTLSHRRPSRDHVEPPTLPTAQQAIESGDPGRRAGDAVGPGGTQADVLQPLPQHLRLWHPPAALHGRELPRDLVDRRLGERHRGAAVHLAFHDLRFDLAGGEHDVTAHRMVRDGARVAHEVVDEHARLRERDHVGHPAGLLGDAAGLDRVEDDHRIRGQSRVGHLDDQREQRLVRRAVELLRSDHGANVRQPVGGEHQPAEDRPFALPVVRQTCTHDDTPIINGAAVRIARTATGSTRCC